MTRVQSDMKKYLIASDSSLRKALAAIDANKDGLVLVVDPSGVLQGTLSDGDIRRFLLAQGDLDVPVTRAMNRSPTVVVEGASSAEHARILRERRLRNLPVVDANRRPVALVNWSDALDARPSAPECAVIMAGGEGKRLLPLTESVPKPMIPVGGKPVLEAIVENLRDAGVRKIFIAINYLGEVIERHFARGEKHGVQIDYLRESKPLGTAGALSLLPSPVQGPVLVMNGDVVTRIGIPEFFHFHLSHRCAVSIAASEYRVEVPYGVLKLAGHFVQAIEEKPTHRFLCNAGIYLLDPEVLAMVRSGAPTDMTEVIALATERGLPVGGFPMHEYWLDIGRPPDLERAEKELSK
jgi:dTDP-glucose pyrophosphorylase